jgi:hypothetical protein
MFIFTMNKISYSTCHLFPHQIGPLELTELPGPPHEHLRICEEKKEART